MFFYRGQCYTNNINEENSPKSVYNAVRCYR
jgi:hypothetical protein